jgi:hypothetical protein
LLAGLFSLIQNEVGIETPYDVADEVLVSVAIPSLGFDADLALVFGGSQIAGANVPLYELGIIAGFVFVAVETQSGEHRVNLVLGRFPTLAHGFELLGKHFASSDAYFHGRPGIITINVKEFFPRIFVA